MDDQLERKNNTIPQSSQSQVSQLELVEKLNQLGESDNNREEVTGILDSLAVALRDEEDLSLLRQVGRVAANLVIDCDENRERLVSTGYIDAVLSHSMFSLEPKVSLAPAILAIMASLHNLSVDKNTTLLEESPTSLEESTLNSLLQPLSSTSSDLDTHLHILTCACNSLESAATPEGPLHKHIVSRISDLTEFVEKADVPDTAEQAEEGEEEDEEEPVDYTKTLSAAKASIVRILVDLSSELPSLSSFWSKMRDWLVIKDRPDLLNCALLSFGNSIKDGLVRNLSIPTDNKTILGDAGIIEKLAEMGIWSEERDLLGSVQGGGASIVKNLCRGNSANAIRFLRQPLDPLLNLIQRADDQALRFECTRVLVEVIKTLSSAQESLAHVSDQRVVASLVKMLVDGGQYQVLQMDAVVSLVLLGSFGKNDMRSTIAKELGGPGLQVLEGMTEDPKQAVKDNAKALLKIIDQ
ncbi:uncharacterized protein L201_006820 [Kwoniella dendrophila CBS 6074]|uniref:Uncharacterized protein n=1 Tax=Kwoniella dendrophila CBS 6074 TaxID=1295534 RepID=A0AAX4K554_9TREE